jgi:nucleotide-binding universal stress UspA family protein
MAVSRSGPVVVGVHARTPDRVLDEAIALAHELRRTLACVYVDESRVPIGQAPDGTVLSAPVAASGRGEAARELGRLASTELTERIAARAAEAGVTVTFHTLAGDPVTALSRFAVDRDARLIVVGTRPPGVRASLSLVLAGPVASRLTRRQPVPVLVVPLHGRSPVPTLVAARGTDVPADVPEPDSFFGEGHA